ncbi:unnamed protein product [Phytophthora lilii]|uniref:Unnamed protein product n=1 Tax=Phytophthora lilii TaxID=2077276 RepID=A0A9W6WKB2_9STRA|nr:unnamed protein product [Phytophthora lilii]
MPGILPHSTICEEASISEFETRNEDNMTVEEAIAFIDSFDDILGDDVSDSKTSVSSPTSNSSSDSGVVYPVVKTKNGPRRKRKSNPPGYTTRVQQRKKAELQGLRDHVRELEHRVDQLKMLRPNSTPINSAVDLEVAAVQAKWEQIVAREYEQRRQSEETNRKLKEILAHQVEVDKNLRRILQKRSLLQGIDFVFGNEPTSRYSFAAFENSKSIMDHLEQKVAKLYLDSGSIFQGEPPPTVSYTMQMKHNRQLGMTAEALSTTAVLCPMEVSADICWKDLSIARPCPEKWARCVRILDVLCKIVVDNP